MAQIHPNRDAEGEVRALCGTVDVVEDLEVWGTG